MSEHAPLHTPARQPEDPDAALRPKSLAEFVGQAAARENLRVFIAAAKARGEAMDHVLFFGPPGLGKTTLAQLLAAPTGDGRSGKRHFVALSALSSGVRELLRSGE